jgi:hypothetical protein
MSFDCSKFMTLTFSPPREPLRDVTVFIVGQQAASASCIPVRSEKTTHSSQICNLLHDGKFSKIQQQQQQLN